MLVANAHRCLLCSGAGMAFLDNANPSHLGNGDSKGQSAIRFKLKQILFNLGHIQRP
ncbi:hypothetical protein [Ensifer aridi]|uniref:hypothetical protein n=1 Tax=Ensifer aridi TaxID=1708715 RepID=UPI0015E45C2A|nr:hypothetical protein [Ensifer aridi]